GCYDDTAVFFFSDHGIYAGDFNLVDINQNTFEDVQTRVPFIIKPPVSVTAVPGIKEPLVELVDFPATVYDMTGIDPGYWHFGKSLIPLIQGETDAHRDAVFSEGGRLQGEQHCMELEYEPGHKDPADIYFPRLSLQASEEGEHTKAVMCRTEDYKYVMRLYEQDELYDLKKDPLEQNNVISSQDYIAVLQSIKERLLRFFLETCDAVPFEIDKRNTE
ncbi:sulfatase/phosphatase domain-containing protein, partial [Planctomycetota bacterium]